MKKSLKLLYLLLAVAFVALTGACGRTSGNSDRPPLQHTDADRKFDIVLEITRDSLLVCNNCLHGKDADPLILDTSNPGFADFLEEWFHSMDSPEANESFDDLELHISVGADVSDATLEKVRRGVMHCGISKISVSNF